LLGPAGLNLRMCSTTWTASSITAWPATGPQARSGAMNILKRFRLSRDRSITVANLVDELRRQNGDYEVSIENGSPRRWQLHAEICSIDAFLRRTIGLRAAQPVAIYRTNDPGCFRCSWPSSAPGASQFAQSDAHAGEVSRILADSGTDILVTDKAVFERSIATAARSTCARGYRPTMSRRRWRDSNACGRGNRSAVSALGD